MGTGHPGVLRPPTPTASSPGTGEGCSPEASEFFKGNALTLVRASPPSPFPPGRAEPGAIQTLRPNKLPFVEKLVKYNPEFGASMISYSSSKSNIFAKPPIFSLR